MSKIDFLPSSAEDTLDVCMECMNDWCVRAQAQIISIETKEMEWPEMPVFHRARSAWFGETSYHVRFIRVWYRTSGVPKCDQRFVKGEHCEPIDFPEQPVPDVNKEYRRNLENKQNGKDTRSLPGSGRSVHVGMVLQNQLISNPKVWWDYAWALLHFAVLGFIAVAAAKSAFL